MANKYVDHALYALSASFTASISGTTLTVSAVSSGRLSLGSQIVCDGFVSDVPLHITALGTGTGGTGTYTLKHAYNGTVTSQAMTSQHGAPLAVSTWGVCEDGDGTAKTAATPSTADIVFTGIPSSGAINVLGVAVTATWATSADNCANLLATAINALTTTAVGPASFTIKSQVRNHLYARGPANGAPAGTCQVMTRQGSASHDGLICFTHTLNNVSSAGTVNFIGGTGGAWGYTSNVASVMWPSAIAIDQYGVWAATPYFTGSLLPGDVVAVRSGKTINRLLSTSTTRTMSAMGSETAPVTFEIDDSTEWPADGVDPVLKISSVIAGNYVCYHTATTSTYASIDAKQYASGQKNLVYENLHTATDGLGETRLATGYPVRYKNILYWGNGVAKTHQGMFPIASGGVISAGVQTVFENCWFSTDAQSAPVYSSHNAGGSLLIGCTFEQRAPTTAQSPVLALMTFINTSRYTFIGCDFKGFVSGSRLHTAAGWPETCNVNFINCDFGNVTERTGVLPLLNQPNTRSFSTVSGSSSRGLRDFFIETIQGSAEWNSSKGYPTLNATLLGLTTKWVIYAVPSTWETNLGKTSPFCLPSINKWNTLDSGSRTVTVNILLESTNGWVKNDISCVLTYTNSAGDFVVADSYDPAGGALTASSATWSSTSYNGQTWTPLEFSMVVDLKKDTEVTAIVRLHSSVANNTLGVFIDPELVVS